MFRISSPDKEEQLQFINDVDLYNPQERASLVKYTQICGIPAILATLAQTGASIFLYICHPTVLSLALAIGGGVFFFASVLALIWASKTRKVLAEEDHALGQAPPSSRLTSIVFFLSFFLAASTLVFITAIYAYQGWNEDYFQAAVSDPSTWIKIYGNNTVDQVSDFFRYVQLTIGGFQILFLFFFLLASRSAFKFLDFGSRSMTQFVYIANVLQLEAGLALIYFTQNLQRFEAFDHISANFPQWNLDCLYVAGIMVASITLLVFVFNWRKWRIGFFFIAFLLLIVFVLLINFTGYAFRHARYTYKYHESEKHCPGRLGASNINDLANLGCPSKYVIVNNTVSTACDNAWLGELWEQDVGVASNKQKHQQGCLNEACCGIVADYYTAPLYLFAHISLIATILVGMVSIGSYYLWYINWLDHGITKSAKDLGWLVLKLALVGVFFWLYFYVPLNTPTEYGSQVTVVPTSNNNITYISSTDIGDNACYSIGNLTLSFNQSLCDNSSCGGYSLVVYLLANQASWSVPSSSPKGFVYLDTTNATTQFPDATKYDGYLALKGDPASIQKAISNQITVCPIQPGKDTLISMKVQQVKNSTTAFRRFLEVTLGGDSTASITLDLGQNLTEVLRGTIGTEYARGKWNPVSSAKVDILRGDGLLLSSIAADSNGDFSYPLSKYASNKPYIVKVVVTATGFVPVNYSVQVGGFPRRVSTEVGFIELFKPFAPLSANTTAASPPPTNSTNTTNPNTMGNKPNATNMTNMTIVAYSTNVTISSTNTTNKTGDPARSGNPIWINLTDAILIQVVSGVDGKALENSEVYLYPGADTQAVQKLTALTPVLVKGNLALFKNVSRGNYVLKVTQNLYGDHVRSLVYRGMVMNLKIALAPSTLDSNTLQLLLNLPDQQDFTLQANFEIEDGTTCTLSALSSSCGGLSKFSEDRQYNSLKAAPYGNYYYLFYVRQLRQPSLKPPGLIDSNVDLPIFERISLAANSSAPNSSNSSAAAKTSNSSAANTSNSSAQNTSARNGSGANTSFTIISYGNSSNSTSFLNATNITIRSNGTNGTISSSEFNIFGVTLNITANNTTNDTVSYGISAGIDAPTINSLISDIFSYFDDTDTESERGYSYRYNPDHTLIALGDIGRTHRLLPQQDGFVPRPLTKSAIFLDIYLPELSGIAGRLYAPSQVPSNIPENESLTWLAFCMDGRKGPSSIRALNTYWDPQGDATVIPSAQTLCAPLYSQPDDFSDSDLTNASQ